MIPVSLRFIFKLLALVVCVIALAIVFARQLNASQRLHAFFVESENCDSPTCFAGIIPGESTPGMAQQMLAQSQFVDTVRTQRIDFLQREIHFTWNGTQPGFLREEGIITLFSAEVESIEIPVDLTLGSIISIMGAPSMTMQSASSLFLSYAEGGFFVETVINCDAVWHSPVTISYRWDNFQLSGTATLDEAIAMYCGT